MVINEKYFNDWRWQLKNSIQSIDDLAKYTELSSEQKSWLSENFIRQKFPFTITPHFASLMSPDLNCPIFRQVIPSKEELLIKDSDLRDPLGEESREKVPHLVHRYPDRVLFLLTDRCASYCRFCTRKRLVGQGPTPKSKDHEQAFSYIKNNPKIREIIFSGGDPLLVNDEHIKHALEQSFLIKHIEVVRFHTRMLSFLPMRITDELCEILSRYRPIFLITHFNHAHEISEAATLAINKLIKSGVVLLNQSVLLANVNDQVEILKELFRKLLANRIKPYYLHQCDLVNGSSHFRVPYEKALWLMENLRGHISGLCLPTLVIDIPGGLGKVPINPQYIVKEDQDFIYLKGFKGEINSYPKI